MGPIMGGLGGGNGVSIRPQVRRRHTNRVGETAGAKPRLLGLLLYLALAVSLLVRPVASHFATSYLGCGVDQPFSSDAWLAARHPSMLASRLRHTSR